VVVSAAPRRPGAAPHRCDAVIRGALIRRGTRLHHEAGQPEPVDQLIHTQQGNTTRHDHLDVFFAGDSAEAKARVAAFLESLGMRALDAGGIEMAYVLEWAGILLVGLARNGGGFDIALGAEVL
jgi:hypothetical protein